jgi:hypothetical protein
MGSSVGTTELTEDQDGGDEGRHGTRAEEVGAATGSATAELENETGGDREHEVGPGHPGQRGEQTWPERVRDRGPKGVGRLGTARDVVRERPSDEGRERDRDAHQPDHQDAEGAEASGDLAGGRSCCSVRPDC